MRNEHTAEELRQSYQENRLRHLAEGGIELRVQTHGGGRVIEHSSVFASWSLSAEIIERIKEQRLEGNAVKLLIVRCPVGRWDDIFNRFEDRWLVDLTDPMSVISFDSSGVNRIFAFIVFGETESRLCDKFLSRSGGCYRTTVVSKDECGTVLNEYIEYRGSGVIDVEVPNELFAKKPFDWKWVNMVITEKPRDQCALRRRRLFAYLLQPIMFVGFGFIGIVFWLISLLVIIILLSLGKKGINFLSLRHPLEYKPETVSKNISGSVFIPTIRGQRVLSPISLSPFVLLMVAAITGFFVDAGFGTVAWLIMFGKIMLIPIVAFFLLDLFVAQLKNISPEEKERLLREEDRRLLEAEMEALARATANPPGDPDFRKLPFRPTTFRFYVEAVKQRFCRGFAA